MSSSALPTEFAPAERASREEIERQSQMVLSLPFMCSTLNALPDPVLVLNRQRQIVFANRAILEMLGIKDMLAVCGARPGEVVGCVHSCESHGGCGTTEFCRECGAVRAILASQQSHATVEECRIQQKTGDALDLRVWAAPFEVAEEKFTLFAVSDISNEKRRKALERIFFHDLLNTAGGLVGYAHILREASPTELDEFANTIARLADKLIDEINTQRDLAAAETSELSVNPVPIQSRELMGDVVSTFHGHEVARGREIKISPDFADVPFTSDRTLVRRVLINMMKNALEASRPGQTVTIGCNNRDEQVEFWIHNQTEMLRNVQLQVFQRSFSTKGSGRGLGTYSMKLLSERYLKGQVSFTSTAAEGTTFRAKYPLFL